MSDIPVCQQCGKKLYANYGSRGLLATPDYKYHHKNFYTEEERNNFGLRYHTPQQSRDGLFS